MNEPEPSPARGERKPIRWWPMYIILLHAVAVWASIWLFYGVSRQQKNIAWAQVLLYTLFLLWVWVVALSRLRWRVRLGITALVLGAVGFAAASLRIRGVTGDLVPVVEWRWSRRALALPETTTPVAITTNAETPPASYPQFLGPNRDGVLPGPLLASDWRTQPPVQLWRQPVGAAWSGFVVAGFSAVTQEQRGEEECVVCYDLRTGRALWVQTEKAHFNTTIAGEGPRATPTITGDRVLALGATGILNCLDLATGRKLWSKNIVQENNSKVGDWGVSGSPLVVGQLVVVCAGGKADRSLVAYDLETGKLIWGAGNASMDYSSPALLRLAGTEQILIFTPKGVVAHEIDRGEILWRHPWRGGHPHIALPIVLPEDRVLISSGYGTGAELLKVTKTNEWTATSLWKSNRLKSKFANLLYRDGFIYGLDDGIMVCLDAADGALKWKDGRYGHGQMILVRDVLLIMAEGGDVVLVDPSPEALRELTRFKVFHDKTWNPPALAGEYLLIRNDKEAACLRLPLASGKRALQSSLMSGG